MCLDIWGASGGEPTQVALKTLLGMMGAAQWREKGLPVPGIKGALRQAAGRSLPLTLLRAFLSHGLRGCRCHQ